MKIRTLTITIITIAALVLPALASAQGYHGGRGHHGVFKRGGGQQDCPQDGSGRGPGHPLLGRIGDSLDLTEAQKEQIETIVENAREQSTALHEQLTANRDSFREANQPGTFDEAAIRAHAAAQAAIKEDLMVIRMKSKADAFAVLTPEQQDKFIDLMEILRETRGPRGGRRGPGSGQGFGPGIE